MSTFHTIIRFITYTILSFLLISRPMAAYADQDTAKTSNMCTRYFSQYEQAHKIPTHLLRSVSITESGYYDKESKAVIPWPWAVNVQGKAYYFKSKREAVNAVRKWLRNGKTLIDVGCMQINLHYHPKAFQTVEEAFDPRKNIAYAAEFLRSNYEKHNGWRKAVAAYHSEVASFGQPYAKKVLTVWREQKANPTLAAHNLGDTSQKVQLQQASKLPSRGTKAASMAYLSPSMRARRNSDLFVRIRTAPSSYTYPQVNPERIHLVENIARNTLKNLNSKPSSKSGSVTVVD